MFGKNAVAFVFLLFLMTKAVVVLGQEEEVFTDSVSFIGFLGSQGEIPGLEFRLVDNSGKEFLDTSSTRSSEIWATHDFETALLLKDSLWILNHVYKIQFLVYGEPNSFTAAQEHVANLLRNGDIEVKTASNLNGKDYISLASKERYSPLFTGRFAYLDNFKAFTILLILSFFLLFAFGMALFMLIYKAQKNRKEKLLLLYDEQVIEPLSEILFEKSLEELELLSDEELYKSFPAKQLQKPLYVQVLVKRILTLNKKVKGDFKLKLKALYRRLKLDKISIMKLQSSQWDAVGMGLVEINEMDLKEALREVKQLVNSPNFQIPFISS